MIHWVRDEVLRPLVRKARNTIQSWGVREFRESSEPFLSVDFWPSLADIVLDDSVSPRSLARKVAQADSPVIFVESGLVFPFLEALAGLREPFTLVTTSNDDLCMPYLHQPCRSPSIAEATRRLLDHDQLLAWFTKNPCLTHPKLRPLPLGPKWQWRTQRFFGESKAVHHALFEGIGFQPRERFLDRDSVKTKLLYFNFGDTSSEPFYRDHAGVRAAIKSALCPRFPWNPSEPFDGYLRTLAEHRFCLSPPGRGIDTHRTWEALMVGTIPIVQSSALDSLFENLPVLIVNDWSVVTESYLAASFDRLSSREYSFEELYSPYWRKLLRKQVP